MEAATSAFRLVHRWLGRDVPPLQDHPLRSSTIREFWNRRWNRPVSGWLASYVYAPVAARKGGEWALVASFVVSGVAHGWMFLVSAGWIAAISATLFFVLQALFVLVEAAIGLRKASPALQRLWTLGLLGVSCPLFVDPVLRVLGL
jgi:D-alanyl-lipoteichoic acid acyltransferase DltB (MBOAT superfamily)